MPECLPLPCRGPRPVRQHGRLREHSAPRGYSSTSLLLTGLVGHSSPRHPLLIEPSLLTDQIDAPTR